MYIFLVDTGTMLTFEMNLAMQRVRDLQDVISRECRIPQEKQVLLISGGDSLDPSERVCRYAAGTDSNPIFLFNKQSLESASPPVASIVHSTESHLRERVEDSVTLTASYETLAARTGLAANFHEAAKEDFQVCQRLVFDQHLQHQGWLAVVANLEDVSHAFNANNKLFFQQFDEFLSQREENLKLLESFPAAVELLAKVPLLQSLETFSLASITSSSEPDERPRTLLEWITAQETNKTLEQMMVKCRSDLEQFEEPVSRNLMQETENILAQVDNVSMKEVRGLEGRLSQLDFFMQAAARIVAEQEQIFRSIENNQTTAVHVQDATVLPELCEIHRHQMPQMLRNHEQLQDIKAKCRCAKGDLSENLHKRLRWVMYVEKSLTEVNNKIFFYKEMLHRLKHHLEIICQISRSPEAYCRSVVEVVRRRRFSGEFSTFAKNLSDKCGELRRDELARRKEFDRFFHRHFLNALFPGLDDIPPSFATKCPDPFDGHLPLLTEKDISILVDEVPQLMDSLRILGVQPTPSVSDLLLPRLAARDVPMEKTVAEPPLLPSTGVERMEQVEDPVPDLELDASSQSVEIITKEESQLATVEPTPGKVEEVEVEPVGVSPGGLTTEGVSPEAEDNPSNDAFMTADFYIDESMPSSMTECASNKKLAELQCVLQDRTTQLEQKEREVLDARRRIEDLTTRTLSYEKTAKLASGLCASLKRDVDDLRASVASSRSQGAVELDAVRDGVAELVRTWNATSERASMDATRSFDENLAAVRERLEAETEEKRELQALLDKAVADCRVLNERVEQLEKENDTYRRTVLELELENEKLQVEYKASTDASSDIIESRGRELEELRNELGHQLDEEKESVRRLSEECTNHAEKWKRLEREVAEEMEKLRADSDVLLRGERDRNVGLEEELDGSRNEVERLMTENGLQQCNIEELNRAIEDAKAKLAEMENRKLAECGSQTDSAEFSDAESQTGPEARETGFSEISLQAETSSKQEDETSAVDPAVAAAAAAAAPPGRISAKPSRDVDVQTDNLEAHSVEVQTTEETMVQLDSILDCTGVPEPCLLTVVETFETAIPGFGSCLGPPVPAAQGELDCGPSLELRVDDYLPLLRHDEIIAQLKVRMEEENAVAVMNAMEEQRLLHNRLIEEAERKFEEEKLRLKADLEARNQIVFNEALNRAVEERDSQIATLHKRISELSAATSRPEPSSSSTASSIHDLSGSRFVQGKLEDELAEAKQEVLRLQSQLRVQGGASAPSSSPMGRSFMGQSFVPFADASALVEDRSFLSSPIPTKHDLDKFKQTLIDMSISSSVSDILMQFVSISRCRTNDIVFFVWNHDLGHYLSYLIGNQIQHFLHVDSASYIEQQSSEFKELHKWMVGEVINHELCLAKKETNRFRVPVGTKFYRVKAKPWTPTVGSSHARRKTSSSHDGRRNDADDKESTEDKS